MNEIFLQFLQYRWKQKFSYFVSFTSYVCIVDTDKLNLAMMPAYVVLGLSQFQIISKPPQKLLLTLKVVKIGNKYHLATFAKV